MQQRITFVAEVVIDYGDGLGWETARDEVNEVSRLGLTDLYGFKCTRVIKLEVVEDE